jgi:hypothetical protein
MKKFFLSAAGRAPVQMAAAGSDERFCCGSAEIAQRMGYFTGILRVGSGPSFKST